MTSDFVRCCRELPGSRDRHGDVREIVAVADHEAMAASCSLTP